MRISVPKQNYYASTIMFVLSGSIIRSLQSARLKYNRYYPDHQAGKVFNDMLGFRTLCDDYEEVLALNSSDHIRIADMSKGKAHDDGYRGVHVYFQLSNFHYPIEIQYNTYYDRQLNNWLHKYVYKKSIRKIIPIVSDVPCGQLMRMVQLSQKRILRRC